MSSLLLACSGHSNDDSKECPEQGLYIELSAARSAEVAAFFVSGPACSGVTARCAAYEGTACVRYFVGAKGAGNCHVEIAFKTGVGREGGDVVFVKRTEPGCPDGFYAQGSAVMSLGEVKDTGWDAPWWDTPYDTYWDTYWDTGKETSAETEPADVSDSSDSSDSTLD